MGVAGVWEFVRAWVFGGVNFVRARTSRIILIELMKMKY